MHRRINAHWLLVGVVSGYVFVDIEEVTITLANRLLAETRDRVLEIEVNAATARTDAATFIADFLGAARRNIARGKTRRQLGYLRSR